MSKTILVTGGAGFIGSHTVVELLERNYKVIVVDDFSNSKESVIERIKQITHKDFLSFKLNMLDKLKLREVFEKNKIDSVIHFAGLKAVGESVEKPMLYYRHNIDITLNLVELMEEYEINNLVFSSSATVYGMDNKVPFVEGMPLNAVSPYAATKLIIERILVDIQKAYSNFNIAILRYFNPVGAHASGIIGEDPEGIPNNLMPYLAQVGSGLRDRLNVFGGDYQTHDGTAIRDYIHVNDLAEGHILALEKLYKEKVGCEAYNLGSGSGYSVLDIVKAYEEVLGKKISYKIVDRRDGDIERMLADITKSKRELSFNVSKSLYDMCKDTIKWQEYTNLHKL
ncbi:UDP-glucose 4-epimerase GalE [Francisella frigiditurris]|uniref:UDP-glucose 4-epimerase n=1 Tax=Francisella frigiditurris TaxID=1542390 RepID=A0A1J0KU74_9GAMM|nr:UDP-glucose 4-epimerase GalE [Francisella frigiditurris]APC97231.1 UDP-glucose 4-epimerase GalE [Francisella frigiditurris]